MAGKGQAANLMIGGIFVAVLAGIAFKLLHQAPAPPAGVPAVSGAGSYLAHPPRTETPLEDYTRFYKRRDFQVDGGAGKLAFYWFEPAGAPYPSGLEFPLVLILHGGTGNAYAGKYLISRQMQLDFPAFIAVPVVPSGMKWDLPAKFPDWIKEYQQPPKERLGLSYAVSLVRDIAQHYPVDTSRIYVLGCSEGGVGTLGAAANYPDVFAAGVAISGTWTATEAAKMTKMPLWIMHGLLDPVMPASIVKRLAASIKQAGGQAIYTEFPQMSHECPSPSLYAKPMWQWLFSKKKYPVNSGR